MIGPDGRGITLVFLEKAPTGIEDPEWQRVHVAMESRPSTDSLCERVRVREHAARVEIPEPTFEFERRAPRSSVGHALVE